MLFLPMFLFLDSNMVLYVLVCLYLPYEKSFQVQFEFKWLLYDEIFDIVKMCGLTIYEAHMPINLNEKVITSKFITMEKWSKG